MTAPASTVYGNLLPFALEYLSRGVSVFPVCGTLPHKHHGVPCGDPGKVPLVQWKKYQDEFIDATELQRLFRRFPDANIGMTTGHLSRALVVDLDGDLAVRLAQARGYDNGPHSFTGRVGGVHRFFAFRLTAPRNFARTDGIDFRGEGGYVILPPSRHALGRSYVWGEELVDLDDLPELPEWIDVMAGQSSQQRPPQSGTPDEVIREPGRNSRLTSIAGSMRHFGATEDSILAALLGINARQCQPPLDDAEVRTIAHSVASYAPEPDDSPHIHLSAVVEEASPPKLEPEWPTPMAEAAFYGPLGDFVRAACLQSEADPAGLLGALLSAISATCHPNTAAQAGDAHHPIRINSVLVGPTALGRKGSASKIAEKLAREVDNVFLQHIVEGLSSGEGLIWEIRDPIQKFDPKKHTIVVSDQGVTEKRLLVVETELGSTLRVLQREGNSLSGIVRRAWDLPPRATLSALVKNSPARSTGAHIVILGHVTREELIRYVDRTDLVNGFANRFLWFAVKQQQVLPFGELVDPALLSDFGDVVRQASEWSHDPHRMGWSSAARPRWEAAYTQFAAVRRGGLYAGATARAPAQVLRIAELYAALECTNAIGLAHLEAALAVWEYTERTCDWIFGSILGDHYADDILLGLRHEGPMSRTEISAFLGRHVSKAMIDRALGLLLAAFVATFETIPTAGRPVQRWRAL